MGNSWRVRLARSVAQDFHSDDLRIPADLTFDVTGREPYVVNTIMAGHIELDRTNGSGRHPQAGDVFVAVAPRQEFTCHSLITHCRTVGLSPRGW